MRSTRGRQATGSRNPSPNTPTSRLSPLSPTAGENGLKSRTLIESADASGNFSPGTGATPHSAEAAEAGCAYKALRAEHLAQKAQAGCVEAFEELVSRFEEPIFNFLRRFIGNHHDAEDLTQETFLKAYRYLPRYDLAYSFASWLFMIARRNAATYFRSEPRFTELPPEKETEVETPATTLEGKDERDSIWKLVQRLKPKQAEALWLRYAEGFSVAETARIMRTNQVHVKVLLHRARASLAKSLIKSDGKVRGAVWGEMDPRARSSTTPSTMRCL